MNKKQLISIIRTEVLLAKSSPERKGYIAGLEEAINIIEGFSDEPQKPVVPQFVADWIEYCKFTNVNLQYALLVGDVYFYNYANQKDFSKLKEFLDTENNQEAFARTWIFGYEVEKEKRYLVKFKGFNPSYTILKYHQYDNTWFFGGQSEYEFYRTKHTRKELEDAGFGWVFDCEGVELQEVE